MASRSLVFGHAVVLLAAGAVSAVAQPAASAGELRVAVVDRPPAGPGNGHYAGNRAPLVPDRLLKLPPGAIKPEGWLRRWLELQRDGLTGHLPEISAWLQKAGNAWLSEGGKGKWGWEEVTYWLKGYVDLAIVLDDPALLAEARTWIEGALRTRRADGDFGPPLRFGNGHRDFWPNMIMLYALRSWHEHTGDRRILECMTRYFRFQAEIPDEEMLSGQWDKVRGGDNLDSIYWLYNRTGEAFLLDLARKIHRCTADWKQRDDLPTWHNVNIAQGFDEPALYYQQSRDPGDLQAAHDNFRLVRRRYGQVPGGMFGADENARPGHDDPHQCIETCGIVEQMFSDQQLLAITGDPFWADHCEEVAFNTYPAAVMPDFRALRYLTGPNQVLSDDKEHFPGLETRWPLFIMSPLAHRCCQHNHSHGWPYFAGRLWSATRDNGLAAVLYSAATVRARVGEGAGVTIRSETRYPFGDRIRFTIEAPAPVSFPLYLRVPGWCESPAVKMNGREVESAAGPGQFIRLKRTWKSGDTVELALPMKVRVRRWERNHHSASVMRGPLTFALRIGESVIRRRSDEVLTPNSQWQRDLDLDQWPAWEIHPETPWNYGLVLDDDDPESSFRVVERSWPADDMPFTHAGAPVLLEAMGRRIPQWRLDENGLAGALQDSPVRSGEPVEQISLVPMGAARLRISSFPVIGAGPEARTWQAGRDELRK